MDYINEWRSYDIPKIDTLPDIYNLSSEDLDKNKYPDWLNSYTIFGISLVLIGISLFALNYDIIGLESSKKILTSISNGISGLVTSVYQTITSWFGSSPGGGPTGPTGDPVINIGENLNDIIELTDLREGNNSPINPNSPIASSSSSSSSSSGSTTPTSSEVIEDESEVRKLRMNRFLDIISRNKNSSASNPSVVLSTTPR